MIAYRHANFGTPLRTEPARQPGRFHFEGDTSPTQYLCLHPLGPLAELMRYHGFRLPEQVRELRTRTWALRLEFDRLPRITFDQASDYDIEPADLVDDDSARCQELAAELRRRNVPGIVAPSAALPGTENVVLFGPYVASPYLVDPVSTVDIPSSITADGARPVLTLVDQVRFKGDRHAGLEAWQNGVAFSFTEPDWAL